MWTFIPPTTQSAGSAQSPTKATIFQLADRVSPGRTKKIVARIRLRTICAIKTLVMLPPFRTCPVKAGAGPPENADFLYFLPPSSRT